jgi:hypothetical protein
MHPGKGASERPVSRRRAMVLDTARGEHKNRTAEYLLGLPLLGDYLEEGLATFNETCEEFDARV